MMIKPDKTGTCVVCKEDKEIWETYGGSCAECFNKDHPSKFSINGVPLVRVVEDLLMERPEVRKITETAMVDCGVHHILRLENDGFIYRVMPQQYHRVGGCFSIGTKTASEPELPKVGVHAADPELIPKLNKLVDEHIEKCDYCQKVIKDE